MPTPLQWLRKLESQIEEQNRYAEPFECRYGNEWVLPFIAQEYREVYGTRVDGIMLNILEAPRTGTAGAVIDALVDRLTVTGGTSDDEVTGKALTVAWEDNDLEVMHREAHREALVKSRAFGAVSRDQSNPGRAILTIEAPEQAAVHRMQGPPYDVDGYFKVWVDEWTGKRAGLLQLPGLDIDVAEGPSPVPDPDGSDEQSRWVLGERRTRTEPVPVVEFSHRPRLLKPPSSEIDRIATEVDIVDLIEGLMVFAGHFGAVPIRYATGLTVPRDPLDPTKPLLGPDGKPLVGFRPRADHFWSSSDPNAKFGQLEPAGLESFVKWSDHALGVIRRQTSVASTYLTLDLKSHMSAELLKTDEAPMVRRIWAIGRDGTFGQAWRRAQTMMMRLEGHPGRVKPTWADPQTRIEAQSVDSFQKAVASGIGIQIAAEQFLGWDPDLAKRAVESAQAQLAVDPIQATIDKLLAGAA